MIRRLPAVSVLAAALLVAVAAPAGAAPAGAASAGASPILAADAYKWFYWIGFVLVLSLIGLLFAIAVGYYVRILRPKWRSRQSS